MRIAIDVSQVIYETGVSTYIRNLVRNLLLIDTTNEYLLFGGSLRRKRDLQSFFDSLSGNFSTKIIPISPRIADIFWNRFRIIPIEKIIGEVDVFHSSDWSQPGSKALKVTTIHDFVPLKFPRFSHPEVISAHHRRLELVKKEVDHIIVPSLATESDVLRLGIEKARISVIPEAPDENLRKTDKETIKTILAKYRISGKYLLAVGVNPRKNTQRIIEAYERVKINGGKELKLVIVGHPYATVTPMHNVIFTGHIFTEELASFYSGAEALIYPSIYEGFGLPVLEAMACGTPVVTSTASSLPEVAGKAAILVDAYSVDEIAAGITQALRRKKSLSKLGFEQVKKYNWKITAEETLKVYNMNKYFT